VWRSRRHELTAGVLDQVRLPTQQARRLTFRAGRYSSANSASARHGRAAAVTLGGERRLDRASAVCGSRIGSPSTLAACHDPSSHLGAAAVVLGPDCAGPSAALPERRGEQPGRVDLARAGPAAPNRTSAQAREPVSWKYPMPRSGTSGGGGRPPWEPPKPRFAGKWPVSAACVSEGEAGTGMGRAGAATGSSWSCLVEFLEAVG
jgi:hypothetical protein